MRQRLYVTCLRLRCTKQPQRRQSHRRNLPRERATGISQHDQSPRKTPTANSSPQQAVQAWEVIGGLRRDVGGRSAVISARDAGALCSTLVKIASIRCTEIAGCACAQLDMSRQTLPSQHLEGHWAGIAWSDMPSMSMQGMA